MRIVQDTHTQLQDLRNENRQVMDEVKAISARARVDQKEGDVARIVETLRSQVDVSRGEVATLKNDLNNLSGQIDSRINDLKSEIHSVKNTIR